MSFGCWLDKIHLWFNNSLKSFWNAYTYRPNDLSPNTLLLRIVRSLAVAGGVDN